MGAKEYLNQLRLMDVFISQRNREREAILAHLTDISAADPCKEKVQGGEESEAGFAERVARLVDLESEIDRLVDEYVMLKHKIIGEIHDLKNDKYVKLLYSRYVENKRFEEIAADMNYTHSYVRTLHRKALQEFERTYTIIH